MPKYVFQEIKHSASVKTQCKSCGKKCQKTVSDYQTVNPFNKNKNGRPKTAEEIKIEIQKGVARKLELMRKGGILCKKCEAQKRAEADRRISASYFGQ